MPSIIVSNKLSRSGGNSSNLKRVHPAVKGWLLVKDSGKTKLYRDPENPSHYRLLLDPQETLRPNSDVSIAWTYSTEPTHYEAVDEEVADEDTSYIETDPDSKTPQIDIFGLPDTAIPPGATINFVRVYNRTRRTATAAIGSSFTVLRTYGTDYYGTIYTPATTYSDHYTEYPTNPYTGQPWTIDELNALEIGVQGVSGEECVWDTAFYIYYPVRCTQVYALIDYTVPVVYPGGLNPQPVAKIILGL